MEIADAILLDALGNLELVLALVDSRVVVATISHVPEFDSCDRLVHTLA
jgi:hypothetical protein